MQKKVVKVQLALSDQVADNTRKAAQLVKELQVIENEIDQVKKSIEIAKSKAKEGESFHEAAIKIGYKIGSALEDLGIEPRSNQLYNSFWEAINSVQDKAIRVAAKIKQLQ